MFHWISQDSLDASVQVVFNQPDVSSLTSSCCIFWEFYSSLVTSLLDE